jgi:hypothetical protein
MKIIILTNRIGFWIALLLLLAVTSAVLAQSSYRLHEESLGPPFTALRTYTFDTGIEGWTAVTNIGLGDPEYSWQDGKLAMKGNGGSTTFGFWRSRETDIITSSGQLYYAIFEVSTDIVDRSMVPQMRIAAEDWDYGQYNQLCVTSLGDGDFSPPTGNYGYYFCFEPCSEAAGAPQQFWWQMLNFYYRDDPWGSLYLDSARIFAAPLDSIATPTVVRVWDFDTGPEGWIAPDVFPPNWLWIYSNRIEDNYLKAIATAADGCLQLKPGKYLAYGYWQSPFEVEIKPFKIYVAEFFLRSDQIDLSELPDIYLTVVSENWQCVVQKLLTGGSHGKCCPGVEGETYSVYFVPSRDWVGTNLGFLFEIAQFAYGENPNARVFLDKVVVKEMDLIVPMAMTAAKPARWLLYE